MSNHFHAQLEKCQHQIALVRETRGDVLLALETRPNDSGLKKQLKELDVDLAHRHEQIAKLQDAATALERQDRAECTAAEVKRLADLRAALAETMTERCATAKVFDAWVAEGLVIMGRYATLTRAARSTAFDLLDRRQREQLHEFLNDNALGVVLADRLARAGWSNLPFLDISNPRDDATCESKAETNFEAIRIRLDQAERRAKDSA